MFVSLDKKDLLPRLDQRVDLYSASPKTQALVLHPLARLVSPQTHKCVLRGFFSSHIPCLTRVLGYLFSLQHKLVAHLGLGQEARSGDSELSSSNLSNGPLRQLLKPVSGLSGKVRNNNNNNNNNNNSNNQPNKLSLVREGDSDLSASRSRHNHHSQARQQLVLVVYLARAPLRTLKPVASGPSVPPTLLQLQIPLRLLGSLIVAIHRFRQACLVLHLRMLNPPQPHQPHHSARLGRH